MVSPRKKVRGIYTICGDPVSIIGCCYVRLAHHLATPSRFTPRLPRSLIGYPSSPEERQLSLSAKLRLPACTTTLTAVPLKHRRTQPSSRQEEENASLLLLLCFGSDAEAAHCLGALAGRIREFVVFPTPG